MTREIKLALILGSALVLVVGALISDHMSGASRATIERIAADGAFDDGGASSRAQEIIIKPAPQPTRLAFEPVPLNSPTIALNEPRQDMFEPLGAGVEAQSMSTASLAMNDAPPQSPTMQLEDAPIDSVAAFRDWAERQGAKFVEMANNAPPATAIEQSNGRRAEPDARPRSEPAREHVVAKGDSLWKLAERYYGDASLHTALEKYNESRLGPRGDLLLDSRILIPSREALTGKPAPAAEPQREPRRSPTPNASPARPKTYTVQRGDTLGVIAQRTLGTSKRWRDIFEANKSVIKDPDVLLVGSTLKIPSS